MYYHNQNVEPLLVQVWNFPTTHKWSNARDNSAAVQVLTLSTSSLSLELLLGDFSDSWVFYYMDNTSLLLQYQHVSQLSIFIY